MNYKITYRYKGIENAVLMIDQNNILGAIGQFYEDHIQGCTILKIEEH